jgi:hypothetical protein
VSIKILRLMFCGDLFDQAIGIGSNHDAPKITRLSSSTSSKFLFASSLDSLMRRTIEYLWIFRSPRKLCFQRVKNQVNQRFLKADMAESPMVARPEISGQQAKLK